MHYMQALAPQVHTKYWVTRLLLLGHVCKLTMQVHYSTSGCFQLRDQIRHLYTRHLRLASLYYRACSQKAGTEFAGFTDTGRLVSCIRSRRALHAQKGWLTCISFCSSDGAPLQADLL